MPARNKTGPDGQGPMTGRGLGQCGQGQRTSFSQGRGFGFRTTNNVELTKQEERKILIAEKNQIEKRLQELE